MDIKKTTVLGVKWTSVSAISVALSTILRIGILTRLLSAADFGLMAIVLFVMNFAILFGDLGFSAGILHKKNITKKEYSSLYWFSIFISIGICIFLYLIAPLISSFYEDSRLTNLISITGLSLILISIGKQFQIREQKSFNFKLLAIIEIFSSLVTLSSAVFFAMNDFGVYSLIYSFMIGIAFTSLSFLILGIAKYGLYFHFLFDDIKPFLKIGGFNTGGQIVNYFNKEVDVLIVGRFFSLETLGMYSLAKQLVQRPASLVNPVLTKVSVPIFSDIQKDKKLLTNSYLNLLNIVSSINLPVYILLFIFAKPVVTLFYGLGYVQAVPLVQLLSIYMIFIMWRNPLGTITIASGRTDLEFYWSSLTFLILPTTIYFAAQSSIEMVAISMIFVMLVLFFPLWNYVIIKIIDVSFSNYLLAHLPNYKKFFQIIRK